MSFNSLPSSAQAPTQIELKCSLTGGPGEFEQQFCSALATYLTDDLGTPFRKVETWHAAGKAVLVDVAMSKADRADVTVKVGYVDRGAFSEQSSSTSRLSSRDRELTPASSRALVRGIGLALGLI